MLHFFGNTPQVKKFNESSDKDMMSSVLGTDASAANKSVAETSVGDYKKQLKEKHKFTGEIVSNDTKTETKTSAVPVVPNINGIGDLTSFTAYDPAFARKYNTFGAPRENHLHQGIDLGSTEGAPVIARETGKVARIEGIRGYGYTVTLDHGNGESTFYAHLKELPNLKIGQTIQRGEAFALVGRTVGVNGEKSAKMPIPHLHLEYLKNGKPQSNVEEWNKKQSKLIMEDRENAKGSVTIGPLSKSNSNKDKTLGVLNNNTNIIQGPTIYQVSEEYVSTYSPATQKLYGYA
jgi:murein DD-endopeptidase MepM/ murein hydrolase activator NlpD